MPDKDLEKWTWNKDDVEWGFDPEPGAKPLVNPDDRALIKQQIAEFKAKAKAPDSTEGQTKG